MRGGKEQANVFTPLEQRDFKVPGASLCVQCSPCCVTGGLGVLSGVLSSISPRRDLSPHQVRYGGAGKGVWSLHPLWPLLWGWQWQRDGGCWGSCPVFLHLPPYTHPWCEGASGKSLLSAGGIQCCHLFGEVLCSLLEANYSQRHFWITVLDQYQEFILLFKTIQVYRRAPDFHQISALL